MVANIGFGFCILFTMVLLLSVSFFASDPIFHNIMCFGDTSACINEFAF